MEYAADMRLCVTYAPTPIHERVVPPGLPTVDLTYYGGVYNKMVYYSVMYIYHVCI